MFFLFRPDALQQHGHHTTHEVVLEDGNWKFLFLTFHLEVYTLDIDLPFTPRVVTVKKNKSVADEYELMEFLGR